MEMTISVAASLHRHQVNKAFSELTGIVAGITADDHLHELEVRYLRTWLTAHPDAVAGWPGSAIAALLESILADGIVTANESAHLLETLKQIIGTDFAATGSVTPDPTAHPLDDTTPVSIAGSGVCLTGEFLYGTRAACERLTERAGGRAFPRVTREVALLVIGARASKAWVQSSYGRKIEAAMALRDKGHEITVISEERWFKALQELSPG